MKFIDVSSEKGNAMLYNIISLIRECDSDKLNIARFAYLCARLKETADNKDDEIKKQYEIFSEKLYGWIHNKTDRKQLTTAIYLYVYFSRKSNEEGR
ncbi:MAG: hypothetical protein LIO69_02940 [Oscillospiraceae bacterium]|nr:hypothetical protein [Oscillospiraceae bacterium]